MFYRLARISTPTTMGWFAVRRFQKATPRSTVGIIMVVSSPIIPSTAMLMCRGLLEFWFLLQSCGSNREETVAAHGGRTSGDTIDSYQALGVVFKDLLHGVVITQLTLYLPGHFVVSCGGHLQHNQTHN
jgi:hypothetical protein